MSGAITRLNTALEGHHDIERELGEDGMAKNRKSTLLSLSGRSLRRVYG
jgi:hypothetical protein